MSETAKKKQQALEEKELEFLEEELAEEEEYKDLGFGTRISSKTNRLINRDGTLNVKKIGVEWKDINPYQHLISVSWPYFFFLLMVAYVIINLVFAGLYMLVGVEYLSGLPGNGGHIGEFGYAFYFSVQTFTTVGYGAISPTNHLSSLLASFEALVGLLGFALATGILYGRFAQPLAKIAFSENAIIAPYNDINSFQFRVVNRRQNQLVDLEVLVALMWYEIENGEEKQHFASLDLERDKVALFPLTWTIVHPIDQDSPLFHMAPADYTAKNVEFLIVIKGFDETFSQTVRSRFSYKCEDILWGKKFNKVFYSDEDGNLVVEVDRINETREAELNPAAYVKK